MKKLALNIDSLKVQTFETANGQAGPANAILLGTRVTHCYSECNACSYTGCNPEQRTEIDCLC